MFRKSASIALLILCAAFYAGCKKSQPAGVAATVNGRAIQYSKLDKQYESQFGTPADPAAAGKPSDDQVTIQKLEVLRSLIDAEIMLQRAEKLNVMAVDSDVEAKFNELKAPYTREEFDRQLAARKMTVDDLKAQLRQDLSISKLFNKEVTAHINITDQDIANFYNANQANFVLAEPQIHMAQILVTPHPEPNVRNLKNDKAQNEQQAVAKIRMIEQRLRAGEDFSMVAQNYSEDPNTAPNGGDLGHVPESALEKANAELRRLVAGLQPGQMSTIKTNEGFRILKVISKEPAGKRDLNDPRVRQDIRETLINRKENLLRAAYYEMARNEAEVVNYLANAIHAAKGAPEQAK
jgi:peptidyl-prolyl cis-trans isomerase SurA